MTPFEKHNIQHLSASSLGLFRAQPALWCLKYLSRYRDDAGPAAWRGSAVEAGLAHHLYKQDKPSAIEAANSRFEVEAMGDASDDVDAERQNIAPMLDQAIATFGPLGQPVAKQLRTEARFDGLTVPVIGYLDFLFDGLIVDLKTTKACPSEIKPDHARQVALYLHSRGFKEKGRVAYVTAKRGAIYDVVEPERAVDAIRRDAIALQNFLARVDDCRDALSILAPDTDHFMWSDTARQALSQAA